MQKLNTAAIRRMLHSAKEAHLRAECRMHTTQATNLREGRKTILVLTGETSGGDSRQETVNVTGSHMPLTCTTAPSYTEGDSSGGIGKYKTVELASSVRVHDEMLTTKGPTRTSSSDMSCHSVTALGVSQRLCDQVLGRVMLHNSIAAEKIQAKLVTRACGNVCHDMRRQAHSFFNLSNTAVETRPNACSSATYVLTKNGFVMPK